VGPSPELESTALKTVPASSSSSAAFAHMSMYLAVGSGPKCRGFCISQPPRGVDAREFDKVVVIYEIAGGSEDQGPDICTGSFVLLNELGSMGKPSSTNVLKHLTPQPI
jgi:hypothetical protein